MRIDTRALVSLIALSLIGSPALAQDSSGATPAPTSNPLEGLFTPQPQYPTPQSHDNPTPVVQGSNPVGGLFNTSGNPSTNYNAPQTPTGANPLQGLFTGQPQYVTPQTQMNKDAVPIKEGPYGTEAKPAGGDSAQKDGAGGEAAKAESKGEAGKADQASADKDKDKDKDKEKAEKEKSDKDKEKADKEDKEKQRKAKAEKEKPALPQVYNPIKDAIYLLDAGQPNDALKRITSVIKSSPNDAQAHYVAAVVQVALRNYAAAISEYQVVLKLVPMTPLAARAAEGLKKLGGPPPDTKLPPLRTYH
ncbi:MAG TPA: tetratricopeptide repeat protein [Candidatus Obscuribacterales bacterium]